MNLILLCFLDVYESTYKFGANLIILYDDKLNVVSFLVGD